MDVWLAQEAGRRRVGPAREEEVRGRRRELVVALERLARAAGQRRRRRHVERALAELGETGTQTCRILDLVVPAAQPPEGVRERATTLLAMLAGREDGAAKHAVTRLSGALALLPDESDESMDEDTEPTDEESRTASTLWTLVTDVEGSLR